MNDCEVSDTEFYMIHKLLSCDIKKGVSIENMSETLIYNTDNKIYRDQWPESKSIVIGVKIVNLYILLHVTKTFRYNTMYN